MPFTRSSNLTDRLREFHRVRESVYLRLEHGKRSSADRLTARRKIRQGVFEHTGLFYNPERKQMRNGLLSPVEFERQQDIKTDVT